MYFYHQGSNACHCRLCRARPRLWGADAAADLSIASAPAGLVVSTAPTPAVLQPSDSWGLGFTILCCLLAYVAGRMALGTGSATTKDSRRGGDRAAVPFGGGMLPAAADSAAMASLRGLSIGNLGLAAEVGGFEV